jgi:hypothetical protein
MQPMDRDELTTLHKCILDNYSYAVISRWIDTGLQAGYSELQTATLMSLFLLQNCVKRGLVEGANKKDYRRHGYVSPDYTVNMRRFLDKRLFYLAPFIDRHCSFIINGAFETLMSLLNENERKEFADIAKRMMRDAEIVDDNLKPLKSSNEYKALSSFYNYVALLNDSDQLP